MKIEGGLTEQPDGSVLFDGGYNENGVSKFGLSFEITHVETSEETSEEEAEEEPEEKEIKFFHHPEHKLRLVNEYEYTNGCSDESYCRACTERIAGSRGRWVYTCPETECDYGVHSACGLLATKIRHPSHPKHVLKLVKLDNPRICDVCKGCMAAGLDYQCAKCDFDMHPLCPELQEEEDGPADEDGYEDASGAADKASEQSTEQLSETQQLSSAQQLLNSQTWMLQQQLNSQMQLSARQTANAMAGIGSALVESQRGCY
ncbi:hypothetical protein M758_5G066500 [Ceratodon purpureus]|nr:hypothetical protein M758_5G066500 [Ceratodon purpureus]